MLTPKGDLAIAELAFFSAAILIALFILLRQGFNRRLGWFYIATLSLLRIIGSSCTLYMETQNDYSTSLLETAAITSSVGTAPLLLALLGFLGRVHTGMEDKGIPSRAFRVIQLAAVAGLIVAIIGGVDEGEAGASVRSTGKHLMEAAAIVFLAIYLGLAAITIWTILNIRWVLTTERKLIQACVAALPFLFVRLIYTVAVAFSSPSSVFSTGNVNVYVQAFMQFAMEAIVVCIFIFAGLMTPKMVPHPLVQGSKDVESTPMADLSDQRQEPERDYRQEQQYAPVPQRQQSPRTLRDYRPSRLIMSAIRDRQ